MQFRTFAVLSKVPQILHLYQPNMICADNLFQKIVNTEELFKIDWIPYIPTTLLLGQIVARLKKVSALFLLSLHWSKVNVMAQGFTFLQSFLRDSLTKVEVFATKCGESVPILLLWQLLGIKSQACDLHREYNVSNDP